MSLNCPLCSTSDNTILHQKKTGESYYRCDECHLIFLGPEFILTHEKEQDCYLNHQNNAEDSRYQLFVSPIVEQIKGRLKKGSIGLDYGSGKDSAVTSLLRKAGYEMEVYDPQFFPDKRVLEKNYDFIVATEVAEHFHYPKKEFSFLRTRLKDNGHLFLMTLMHDEVQDFSRWFYIIDPTHVVFYHSKTFAWIKNHHQFENYQIKGDRIAILSL